MADFDFPKDNIETIDAPQEALETGAFPEEKSQSSALGAMLDTCLLLVPPIFFVLMSMAKLKNQLLGLTSSLIPVLLMLSGSFAVTKFVKIKAVSRIVSLVWAAIVFFLFWPGK